MTHSESLAALWPALVGARRKFGALTKDGAAQIGNSRSYRYSTLGQVLDVAMPSLLDHGLLVVQAIDGAEAGLVLRTRLVHAPTAEYFETTIPLREAETPQALGSAVTYARRYALLALLAVAPVDDDDGAAAGVHEAHRPDVAAPGPTSRPRRPKGARPSTSPPASAPPPVVSPSSPSAAPYRTTDTAVSVVEDRPAKDGTVLHWVRDVGDERYYTRDGILAHRLAAIAGSGEIVRLMWQPETTAGDRVVRLLRGVVPAADDAPF